MNIPFCVKIVAGNGQVHYGDAALTFKAKQTESEAAMTPAEVDEAMARLRAMIAAQV